jgi:hypothetical protein
MMVSLTQYMHYGAAVALLVLLLPPTTHAQHNECGSVLTQVVLPWPHLPAHPAAQ